MMMTIALELVVVVLFLPTLMHKSRSLGLSVGRWGGGGTRGVCVGMAAQDLHYFYSVFSSRSLYIFLFLLLKAVFILDTVDYVRIFIFSLLDF